MMGYQFDQDDTYDLSLDEVAGAITIVGDDIASFDYIDLPTDMIMANIVSG
jgi:hypothetical protein